MKKILAIVCSILMIASLVGCSQEATNQKTEEELREEIKAELLKEASQDTERLQINTEGDLILLNDDGSSRTLVEASRGYQNMQSITFLENEDVIVLMANYKSSPLGVYQYNLQEDSFTIVMEPVKGYSIVDNTIKVSMADDSIKYYDLNGYEVDQPGMSVPTTPASEYETNKQYQFDFEGRGSAATFSVDTDGFNYFDVIVNGVKYSIDSDPQLVYDKYKLTEIAESGRYALTFFAAAPPFGDEVVFYEYTMASGLEKIGKAYIDDGTDLFNASIDDLVYSYVIINNQRLEFDRSISLSGFTEEYIRGTQINYENYAVAIIPFYEGKNTSKLNQRVETIGSVTQNDLTLKLNFAVFGTLTDVNIIYYEGMDSNGVPTDLGTINNAHVFLDMWVPNNDMTYVKVTGIADKGNEIFEYVEFTMDDMRDVSDYDVLLMQ